MKPAALGWLGILRLSLVQTAMGAVVVLTTSTMNRIMVLELALPALLPGALVALHYAVQMCRPRMGHGSDQGGRRSPWIIGGMAVLALGGMLAGYATSLMGVNLTLGTLLAILGFAMIGIGAGAAGTSLLVLMASIVEPRRRAPAATAMWTMMIAGFAVTGGLAGHFLDPYSPGRLVRVTCAVSAIAFLLSLAAIWGIERRFSAAGAVRREARPQGAVRFLDAVAQVWREPEARAFTIFVFFSMLAYSAQELILEPFAGLVFGMTPGESAKLSGMQNGGVLVGMLLIAAAAGTARGRQIVSLRAWTIGGCVASAAALVAISLCGQGGSVDVFRACVMALGLANGAFAIAAIASMMELGSRGNSGRVGVRIGLWGAAQALAFAFGGFSGALCVDIARALLITPATSYALVLVVQALMFVIAAGFAARVGRQREQPVGDLSSAGALGMGQGG
jgi:BCD family chlorophyll transporter-like MFS transporter